MLESVFTFVIIAIISLIVQVDFTYSSSHSILNYPMFFGLSPSKKVFPSRELLILDEAHLLETEIVKFRGLSISKRRWKKHIPTLEMVDYGYDDIENWIDFLIDLESKMLDLTGNSSMAESPDMSSTARNSFIVSLQPLP